jgi:2-keto-4-pentenoate hydratase
MPGLGSNWSWDLKLMLEGRLARRIRGSVRLADKSSAESREIVRAGDIILTGTALGLHHVKSGDYIRVFLRRIRRD